MTGGGRAGTWRANARLVGLLLLAVTAVQCASPTAAPSAPAATSAPPATADPASASAWQPTVVLVRQEHGAWTFQCGGVAIGPSAVLTAAHCIEDTKGDPIGVAPRAGEAPLAATRVDVHPRRRAEANPQAFDLAVVHVSAAARLPSAPIESVADGSLPRTVTFDGSGDAERELWTRRARLVVPRQCFVQAAGTYDTASMLCVGGEQDGDLTLRVCPGDSGGPVWTGEGSSRRVVGVISFGRGCDGEQVAVAARVGLTDHWVEDQSH